MLAQTQANANTDSHVGLVNHALAAAIEVLLEDYSVLLLQLEQQHVAQQVRFISVISLIGCDVALTSNSCYLIKKRCVYSYFLT